jgi:acyl-CoA synthetase (AMP-forming)/AMP-acid ligase II
MAFRDDRVLRTWSQVYERTANLGGCLGALGACGNCVAIVLENPVELAESYLAAVRAGTVAVCLNARAGLPERQGRGRRAGLHDRGLMPSRRT